MSEPPQDNSPHSAPLRTPSPPTPPPREVASDELLHGDRCLVIIHGGERYRLIETRNGKLMLQK